MLVTKAMDAPRAKRLRKDQESSPSPHAPVLAAWREGGLGEVLARYGHPGLRALVAAIAWRDRLADAKHTA